MMIAWIIASFIIGSIPIGLLIAKSKGIDLRKVGSGNIGATNVMRAVGKEAALLTLLGDIGKGIIPIVIVRLVSPGFLYEAAAGFSAIMGHNFSIFLKFKGGKGVATSLGVLVAFSPHVGLFTAMLWLMTAKWTRYSSLSALVAFGLLPLSFYLIHYSRQNIIFGAIIAFLIFIRHTANIKRLIQGTENKIGQKANGHKRDQR